MQKRWMITGMLVLALAFALSSCTWFGQKALDPMGVGATKYIEVVIEGNLTDARIAELEGYGQVVQRYGKIGGVLIKAKESQAAALASLPFVRAVGEAAERHAYSYEGGLSTWDLDIINVTEQTFSRVVNFDGSGVYVAVLDTGLVKNWRDYLPEEQVAVAYAKAFNSGASDRSNVADVPHLWERDTESHGTHVTSTILGYNLYGTPINGVAPKATVIPVKVLGNNGGGWSPGIAEGIEYVADLKDELGVPMVINMSLGGPVLSPLEEAAIDYAIGKGVIVVASAGNEGEAGMGYPGAYAPVISVGASGWVGEWPDDDGSWWTADVPDPTTADMVYVCDFSSRELPGQDLDVLAPGSWIVGPYLAYGAAHPSLPIWSQGKPGQYYFLGGTSMASPHVAGLVALMLEADGTLTAAAAELALESTALPIPPGSATVGGVEYTWGADATGAGLVQADALGL